MAAESNNIEEILRPFYQRASEAEDRLTRLEASLTRNKETGNDEQLKLVSELKSELEDVKAKQVAEREKAMKEVEHLAMENAKLQYRIIHLVRALKEADGKLAANELFLKWLPHRQALEDILSSGAGSVPLVLILYGTPHSNDTLGLFLGMLIFAKLGMAYFPGRRVS
ncbi:hypothetical protein OROHE_026559 [Orobanche hederae]